MFKFISILCLALFATTATAQTADELQALEGSYLFEGTAPFCEAKEFRPSTYYNCNITADAEGHLHLTGFVGEVDSEEQPYFVGTYDADKKAITFCCGPDGDGEKISDRNGYCYFIYDFTLTVGTDKEGRTTLSSDSPFWFYAQKDRQWHRASYDALTFTKGAQQPTWDSYIDHPEEVEDINALLDYKVFFKDASNISVSDLDIMGLIYDENGHLYAIAVINAIFNVYGSFSANGNIATIQFHPLSALDPQVAVPALVEMFPDRPATPGQATVVFRPRGFIIDDYLLTKEIVNVVTLK